MESDELKREIEYMLKKIESVEDLRRIRRSVLTAALRA